MHVLQASFSRHEYRARQDNKTGKAAAGMVGDSIQSAHRHTAYLPLGTAATGSVDDRPHMAGQRPRQVAGQRLKRSQSCLSSARIGVARRMAAYRCAVQLNVRFHVKPPSACLAENRSRRPARMRRCCPTSVRCGRRAGSTYCTVEQQLSDEPDAVRAARFFGAATVADGRHQPLPLSVENDTEL